MAKRPNVRKDTEAESLVKNTNNNGAGMAEIKMPNVPLTILVQPGDYALFKAKAAEAKAREGMNQGEVFNKILAEYVNVG